MVRAGSLTCGCPALLGPSSEQRILVAGREHTEVSGWVKAKRAELWHLPSAQRSVLSPRWLALLLASQLTGSLSTPGSRPQLELPQQTPAPGKRWVGLVAGLTIPPPPR